MDFISKMEEAMMLLQKACESNEEWANCVRCPFVDYCNTLEEAGFGTPDDDDFLNSWN